MTQLRPPLTFADAMTRVAGVLGWPVVAAMTRRNERTLRYWSQPTCKTTPTLAQALELDAAYGEAGGQGAPFMEAYAFQLDLQIQHLGASRQELAAELASAAQESGEALANAIRVSASNASPREVMRAIADCEEAGTAWQRILRRLSSFLPIGAGPLAGQSGGSSK